MKKCLLFLFLFWGIVLCNNRRILPAQEADTNWDIDSLFENPGSENGINTVEEPQEPAIPTMRDRVIIEASYNFLGGFSPGWTETPWYEGDRDYVYVLGAKLEALLSMDFQLTQYFRVWNAFSFSVPDSKIFALKEFYFDYNFGWIAFLRAGLCEVAWGISPNYPFTNLPARIPDSITDTNNVGDSYLAKLDIPIGIGGLQLLAMTRYGYMENTGSPEFEEFAYGIKYNLAFELVDIDAGTFYYHKTPLRFFISLKTTLGNTELYTEGLAAVSYETWDDLTLSGNIGFVQDLFNGKLSINGEAFYNGEKQSQWWRPKSDTLEEDAPFLIEGLNTALTLIFRPGFFGMRIFCQGLYAFKEKSAWIMPGISIRHKDQLTATLTVPMALGSRDGTYYHHNMDKENRPFSITLAITISGSFRYTL
ncbi:hypothetical protein AGMMS50230_20210 [Spirochaetia bacterium]|nr:hypothetical protein AGMMS50230_20210 [Spirochaetia bacterium]